MTTNSARAGDPQGTESGCADYHRDTGSGNGPVQADPGADISGSLKNPEARTIIRIQEIDKNIKSDLSLEWANICRILKKIKEAESADGYLPDQYPDSNRICYDKGISLNSRGWHEEAHGEFDLVPEIYPDPDEMQNRTAGVLAPHLKDTGFR